MRRSTFLILLSSIAAFSPISARAQDFKIGVVDMKEVFAEYYKAKANEKSVHGIKTASTKGILNEIKEIERAHPYGEIDDSNAPRQQIEAFLHTTPRVYGRIPEVRRFLKKQSKPNS